MLSFYCGSDTRLAKDVATLCGHFLNQCAHTNRAAERRFLWWWRRRRWCNVLCSILLPLQKRRQ
ncbi:hypothetical protein Hanom_Chr10g00876951 [Helianthus anomalus]